MESATAITKRELARLVETRLEYLVEVDQPLVLISHISRSGGTLLSQLLDNHPQLHVHPYELEIGFPDSITWPRIDMGAGADAWFEQLQERHVRKLFADGYTKNARKVLRYDGEELETFPFALVPSLQRHLFTEVISRKPPTTPREVLDRYFTSYFNAWLDYGNLFPPGKRWIVGFRARLAQGDGHVRLFETYPDGRLIACVRDPRGWFASTRRLWPEQRGELSTSIETWLSAARDTLDACTMHGDRVLVVSYEHLVGETSDVMGRVAARLGIDDAALLREPTYNGMPIKANSSYPVSESGILRSSLAVWEDELTPAECARIEELTADAYGRLIAHAL